MPSKKNPAGDFLKKIQDLIKKQLGKISIPKGTGLSKAGLSKFAKKDPGQKVPGIPDREQSEKLIKNFVRTYFGRRSNKGSVLFEGDRPMKYPYTFTAKIMQFPYVFYAKKQWIYRHYLISLIVCLPIFRYFSKLGSSNKSVRNVLSSGDIMDKCRKGKTVTPVIKLVSDVTVFPFLHLFKQ